MQNANNHILKVVFTATMKGKTDIYRKLNRVISTTTTKNMSSSIETKYAKLFVSLTKIPKFRGAEKK